jgi:Kef-type K+ transport system membrane component KefB
MEDFHVLLTLMVVVWLMGKLFRWLTLPVLFGELLGGIIVGPLVLNLVDPGSITLTVLAELGVFFLMLHAGIETDPNELLKGTKKSILIALGGLIIPFTGTFFVTRLFSLTIYESLFIATTVSATAIAITVRLLKDCKIQNTDLGHTILGAAIITDILVLILFSVLLNFIEYGTIDMWTALILLLKIVAFFGIILFAGFKLQKHFKRLFKNKGFTLTLIFGITIGLIAEKIGLHIIIGAFMAGLFVSSEAMGEQTYNKIEDRIYGLSYSFLGPIFFTSLAFHIKFDGILEHIPLLISLFFIAFFGKIIGSGLGAYIQKIPIKKAFLSGLVMNSRGALDLIIISLGLKIGIIDDDIFSILVAVAFTATLSAILIMKPMKKRVMFNYR